MSVRACNTQVSESIPDGTYARAYDMLGVCEYERWLC